MTYHICRSLATKPRVMHLKLNIKKTDKSAFLINIIILLEVEIQHELRIRNIGTHFHFTRPR